jgi:Cu(I)/Ag(I) efflux system membrane fusion protein
MSTRRQTLASALILGLAVAVVALYALLGSGRDAKASDAGGHAGHGAGAAPSGGPRAVRIGAEAARRIGVTYATVEPRDLRGSIQTVGTVTYDETAQAIVNPKIEGWIERLYVDYTGAPVRRGQPLMEVHSPMLVAAQEELLLARRLADQTAASGAGEEAVASARALVEAARRRLRFADVSAAEIARIERGGAVRRTVTLYAPASGVVVEKTAVAGGRVMPGMDLMRIADLSTVWIEGEVFEKDLGAVAVGQPVRVSFEAYPGEVLQARVGYIQPSVALESRTGRIRIALANPGTRIRPGMYARLEVQAAGGAPALAVPRGAVHATGERSVVFVRAADGSLAHREVTTGRVAGEYVEVLSGLAEGETVVASANFLVDAEASMGGAMPGMDAHADPPRSAAPAADPHAGHPSAETRKVPPLPPAAARTRETPPVSADPHAAHGGMQTPAAPAADPHAGQATP